MNEEELKKAVDKLDFNKLYTDKKDLLKTIFVQRNFGLAAESIGKGDGDKNLIKDLLCKEEERIANFTVKDFNVERGDDEEDFLPDDMLKREKEEKHYQLALKIKKYLKDYDWAEKIVDETLKRAKNLKYPNEFLFNAIIFITAYDEENETQIIEFLNCIEANGIQGSRETDEFELYQRLYIANTKSNKTEYVGDTYFEIPTAEYYDKEKAELYIKKMENLVNEKYDLEAIAISYLECGNKEKTKELFDKAKEKINLNDVEDAKFIIRMGMSMNMQDETTALFNESLKKLNKEDIARLKEHTCITDKRI